MVAVEAKILESFGPAAGEQRANASEGQKVRLNYLRKLLGVDRFDGSISCDLPHRTASAILTARDFHAV